MTILADLLSSRVKAEVFRLLFGVSARELHLRELERQSGLAVGTVRQELSRLVRLEMVEARRDGNRLYYRANQRHPLYPDIRSIVLKTIGLVDVLREALQQDGIQVAFVFGSISRSEETADSDIDLTVIGAIGLISADWRFGIGVLGEPLEVVVDYLVAVPGSGLGNVDERLQGLDLAEKEAPVSVRVLPVFD